LVPLRSTSAPLDTGLCTVARKKLLKAFGNRVAFGLCLCLLLLPRSGFVALTACLVPLFCWASGHSHSLTRFSITYLRHIVTSWLVAHVWGQGSRGCALWLPPKLRAILRSRCPVTALHYLSLSRHTLSCLALLSLGVGLLVGVAVRSTLPFSARSVSRC